MFLCGDCGHVKCAWESSKQKHLTHAYSLLLRNQQYFLNAHFQTCGYRPHSHLFILCREEICFVHVVMAMRAVTLTLSPSDYT